MTHIKHPRKWMPGDQVTLIDGTVITRRRRTWKVKRFGPGWTDDLMDEYLATEHPKAYVSRLADRPKAGGFQ